MPLLMVHQIRQYLDKPAKSEGLNEKVKSTYIVWMSSNLNQINDPSFIKLATQVGVDQIMSKPITRRDL